ncbi:SUMO ligase siz1 [Rhizopus stolonifer]|uniref:SUMO ligase siz1 n=1 Tax=Rhizopus stolonifer TaxID=4846 RepID=A0A367JTA4_RHIST|nr:SUMO ligase siz1 [Rhizopus stolonifer]
MSAEINSIFYQSIQKDLRKATVKEIGECIKAVNSTLLAQARMSVSGRKDELITRMTKYIISLIANNKRANIQNVVRIVNEIVPKKIFWRFENDRIYFHSPSERSRVAFHEKRGNTIENMDFKPSPFLKPIARLTHIKVCPIANKERQSRVFQFTLADDHRAMLATPNAVDDRPIYQIRFYCAKYTNTTTSNLLVEFPNICELKVNGNVIGGSILRCLKNKPGTVNPPDLTIMTRKSALNNVELVYVSSDTPFIASAYIVERTPVITLIQTLRRERVLPKEKVLERLQEIQQDTDIIMESETLSTKDPLAFTRIVTPIRSKNCQHLQCFDAYTYLTMNEQTPTWTCPVCNRQIEDWGDLIVDQYFSEMLKNTPKHIDSVRVEPNGQVTIIDENPDLAQEEDSDEDSEYEQLFREKASVPPEEIPTILLDDDEEELQANPIAGDQQAQENIPTEPPRKKQKSDVIDLTIDSDEENENTPIQFVR